MLKYLYFYRFIFVPEFACNLWNILKININKMLEKHHKHVFYEKNNYFIIGHLSDDCRI